MEAIAAFGLACNVVQVIDVSMTAVKTGRQVYRLGSAADHVELDIVAQNVQTSTDNLREIIRNNQAIIPTSKVEQHLLSLALQCSKSAEELHRELQKLKSGGGRRGAIKSTLRTFKKHGDIEKLAKTVDQYQKLLDTSLLASLREHFNAAVVTQRIEFQSLDQNLKDFVQRLSDGQTNIENLLKSGNATLEQAIGAEHAETRVGMTQGFQILQNRLITEAQRQQFLDSLRYNEIFARQNQISPPQPDTFHWLFEEALAQALTGRRSAASWSSFPLWLRTGNGIYWINGKPGSGKSSLMKFILNDERTVQHLRQWQPLRQPQIIPFFFWLVGSPMQKSLHGLICSLVYQTLSGDHLKIETLLTSHVEFLTKQNVMDWDTRELVDLLLELVQMMAKDKSFCFLIDGLDEFDQENDFEHLCEIITALAVFPTVKLCISSRPEAHVASMFAKCPSLRLQDLTLGDIKRYVTKQLDRFESQTVMVAPLADKDRRALINEFVLRANGVFLWIRLATKDVLQGIRKQDSAEELRIRLSRLPSEIGQLYENMLQRLGPDLEIYKREASLYLKIACVDSTMSKLRLWAAFGYGMRPGASQFPLAYAITASKHLRCLPLYQGPGFNLNDIEEDVKRTMLRIGVCCNGLLEIVGDHDAEVGDIALAANRVQLTHRTVRDFLLEKEAGKQLLNQAPADDLAIFSAFIQTELLLSATALQSELDVSRLIEGYMIAIVHDTIPLQYFFELCQHMRDVLRQYFAESKSASTEDGFEVEYRVLKDCCCTAVDFVGLVAPFVNAQMLQTLAGVAQWNMSKYYQDYLLLCVSGSSQSDKFQQQNMQFLLSSGANIDTKFYLPVMFPLRCSAWSVAVAETCRGRKRTPNNVSEEGSRTATTGAEKGSSTNTTWVDKSHQRTDVVTQQSKTRWIRDFLRLAEASNNHSERFIHGFIFSEHGVESCSLTDRERVRVLSTDPICIVICELNAAYLLQWAAVFALKDATAIAGVVDKVPFCSPLALWRTDLTPTQPSIPSVSLLQHFSDKGGDAVELLPEDSEFIRLSIEESPYSVPLQSTWGARFQKLFEQPRRIDIRDKLEKLGYYKRPDDPAVIQGPIHRFKDEPKGNKDVNIAPNSTAHDAAYDAA